MKTPPVILPEEMRPSLKDDLVDALECLTRLLARARRESDQRTILRLWSARNRVRLCLGLRREKR